jgi:hypothetical protein
LLWEQPSEVLFLLAHGANPNLKTKAGRTCEELCGTPPLPSSHKPSSKIPGSPESYDQMKKLLMEASTKLKVKLLDKKFYKGEEVDI